MLPVGPEYCLKLTVTVSHQLERCILVIQLSLCPLTSVVLISRRLVTLEATGKGAADHSFNGLFQVMCRPRPEEGQ